MPRGARPSARAPRQATAESGRPSGELYGSRRDDDPRKRPPRHDGRQRDRAPARLDSHRRRTRRRARRRRPGRACRGSRRRGRHARARQHPPPPLPDPHARPGPGRRALHLAPNALPGLGPDRRGDGVRRRPHRHRRARALGLHDRVRPSLRLPPRRLGPRRGRAQGCGRDRRPDRRLARVDGPRRLRRRPPARTTSSRRSTTSSPIPSASPASSTVRWPRSSSHPARRSRSRHG